MHDLLTFDPIYKDYLWGGRRLSAFGKELPAEGIVAESWELSCQANGPSVIANGPDKGRLLRDVIDEDPTAYLGDTPAPFPLLIKLIDALQDLSVQVHPNDAKAKALEGVPFGKNELWYVLAAEPGAELVVGLQPGVSAESLRAAIAEGRCEDCLRRTAIEPGDVINIPAGLVHAITAGLIVYEVQQSCDITYRLYDYNRRGADGKLRDLHVDKALQVIDFERAAQDLPLVFKGLDLQDAALWRDLAPSSFGFERRLYVLNRYFTVERLALKGEMHWQSRPGRFHILTVIEGEASARYVDASGQEVELKLPLGKTCFVPADRTEWQLSGEATLIHSEVGDLALFEQLKQAEPELASRVALEMPFETA